MSYSDSICLRAAHALWMRFSAVLFWWQSAKHWLRPKILQLLCQFAWWAYPTMRMCESELGYNLNQKEKKRRCKTVLQLGPSHYQTSPYHLFTLIWFKSCISVFPHIVQHPYFKRILLLPFLTFHFHFLECACMSVCVCCFVCVYTQAPRL